MKRWLNIAAAMCIAVAAPLVAQQASSPATPTQAGASTAQPGPRLAPEFRSVQPVFANRTASATAVVSDTHTIRMSTLVLVLVIVIAVLLIAK